MIEAPIDRGVVSARYKIRNVLASKLARTLILALACILIVLSCTNYYEVLTSPISPTPTGRHGEARVHLLVPATSSNPDLCKLLLSAQILGYPAPILINYGATEFEDPYVQHLYVGLGRHIASFHCRLRHLARYQSCFSMPYANCVLLFVAPKYKEWSTT